MKKENQCKNLGILGLVLLIFGVLSVMLVLAADTNVEGLSTAVSDASSDTTSGLPSEIDTGIKIANKLSDEELRKNYLKQEWTKILNNSKAGPYLVKADEFLTKASPVFKTFLGLEFTFSWIFLLTFVIYFVLLNMVFKLSRLTKVYLDKDYQGYVRFGIIAAFFILFSSVRIPKYLASGIIILISGNAHWAVQLLLSILVTTVIIIVSIFFDQIGKFFKKLATGKKAEKSAEDIEKLKETNKNLGAVVAENAGDRVEKAAQKALDDRAEKELRGSGNG
ncbi:hypothetical protein GOV14_05895 [Candidatus Pacearchaeota archaeon]|nr:hypothetical protein [Candidatus Pacearchaeota archaeon]